MTAHMPTPPQPPREYQDDLLRYKPDNNSIPPQARKAMANIPPQKAYKNASGNFYAIAGFSFINSLISIFGGGLVFVIGLGITQFIDAIAYLLKQDAGDSGFIFNIVALVFDLAACLTFVIFGYFTSKGRNWALMIGMILYALDAVLMVLFKDWIGFAFHLFFLWQLWMMYRVLGYWRKLAKQPVDPFSQNLGLS